MGIQCSYISPKNVKTISCQPPFMEINYLLQTKYGRRLSNKNNVGMM